jgi:Leucine-rich repeat (LRR) protein
MSVPKLSVVYLRNNKISVVESRSFSNLSSLSFVYLTNNFIQKIQPDAFVDTPSVTYINLDSKYLTEIPSLIYFSTVQFFEHLYCSGFQMLHHQASQWRYCSIQYQLNFPDGDTLVGNWDLLYSLPEYIAAEVFVHWQVLI